MSKVSDAKRAQGYERNPLLKTCNNCDYFDATYTKLDSGYVRVSGRKCSLGGFAVKPMATCSRWSA